MMGAPVLLNPSNFLGVALVINRPRDGPRFVFHYPPRILPANSQAKYNDDCIEDLNDDEVSPDQSRHRSLGEANGSPTISGFQQWNHNDHLETDKGAHIVPWEHVAGFPTKDLENILTPARAYHKRLFQVSLDSLYCLSYPVYVPESGIWKRKKKKHAKDYSSKVADGDDQIRSDAVEFYAHAEMSQTETKDSADQPAATAVDEAEEKRSGMTMFNLVFILSPRKHEIQELAETLYTHIIKKVNKAYKYTQQRNDFVWKESKRILALKDRGREDKTRMSVLWKDILEVSTLASSMQQIFDAVSQNKVAEFQLDTTGGTVAPSVQIPVPFYVTELPPDDDETTKGLWLTTANSSLNEDVFDEPEFLDRNFALLLMHDEKKIIAELQTNPDERTPAMVEFVRLSKPTSSFYQVGQSNFLSPTQVRKFAHHFIYWRRAIAIPPFHQRDVYVLSPNCDTRKLPQASLSWTKAFPLAPALPNFLAELSNAPRPYKWHSPSKAHRPTYLQMLAWLMRGGWVTQLCTFAYVVVWPEILYEVEYENEAEELKQAESLQATGNESTPSLASSDEHTSSPEAASLPTLGEQVAEKARLERMADKAQREAAEKTAAHGRKQIPVPTSHPSTNNAQHLSHMVPYIIVDAKKATGRDSQYLSAIRKRFIDPKVAESWPNYWKYFNGRSALERIAQQEDRKRKEIWNLLTAMSEYLLCVRHW